MELRLRNELYPTVWEIPLLVIRRGDGLSWLGLMTDYAALATDFRATQGGIADGLGLIPKDGPETYYYNFDPQRRGWFHHFDTPRNIIWMGTCWTLHSRRILYSPGAIIVHGGYGFPTLVVRRPVRKIKYLTVAQNN